MSVVEKPWGRQIFDDSTGELLANIIKNRRLYVLDSDYSLEPGSLVGSAFHVFIDDKMVWQGVIVAEPEAGRYLCDIDRLAAGAERVQRLFSLDTLMGLGEEARRLIEGSMGDAKAPVIDPYIEWRLYDSQEAANAAFQEWVLNDPASLLTHPQVLTAEPEEKKAAAPRKAPAKPRKGVKKNGN